MNNFVIQGLCLDSRHLKPGEVFIAIPGTIHDGRHFIADVIARGAAAVLTEPFTQPEFLQSIVSTVPVTVPIIEFSELKNAVGYIASRFYDNPSHHMPVIGITGTNGKTSSAHFIAQLLQSIGKSCGMIGTLGAGFLPGLKQFDLTTPDPIALQRWLALMKTQGANAVAMEVTSHALAQNRVAGVQFHTTAFTNLTRDHLDYHENFEDYFAEKLKLFTQYESQYRIINLDDPYGLRIVAALFAKDNNAEVFGVTLEASAKHIQQLQQQYPRLQMITVSDLKMNDEGMCGEIDTPWGHGTLVCELLGKFNLSNILTAMAAVCLQGVNFSEVLAQIRNLRPVSGRMNRLGGGKNQPAIVIDYAHTPDALAKVLMAIRPHCLGKLWCVFGCGGDRDPGKRPLMAKVVEEWSDHIIVTQDNPRTENPDQILTDILQGFDAANTKPIQVESDRAKAIDLAIMQAAPQDIIVIAGKGHETYQIIQTEKIPFLDEACARAALARRRA